MNRVSQCGMRIASHWVLGGLLVVVGCTPPSAPAQSDPASAAAEVADDSSGFDPAICSSSSSMVNLAGAGSPECQYYCQDCLGLGQPAPQALDARFQSVARDLWQGTWLSWVPVLYNSLAEEAAQSAAPLEFPPVSPNIDSALSGLSVGACLGMTMSALVSVIEYYSQEATPEAAYSQNGGKALCGVVWAVSACKGQFTVDPATLLSISALSVTCSIGTHAADAMVCSATKSACVASVAAAQPLIAGNLCCCQGSDGSWTLDRENPCMNAGGQFRAGTCGDAVPFSADQCQYLDDRLSGRIPPDDDWADAGTSGGGDWGSDDAGGGEALSADGGAQDAGPDDADASDDANGGPGDDDAGDDGDPCTGLGDGDYCGGDGVAGDADTLYTCSGGTLASSQLCSAGCLVNPDGSDACE